MYFLLTIVAYWNKSLAFATCSKRPNLGATATDCGVKFLLIQIPERVTVRLGRVVSFIYFCRRFLRDLSDLTYC